MKTTQDLPLDPLGGLGAPIRPSKPAPVDTVKPFETGDHGKHIGNADKAIESIVETLRKKSEVTPGSVEEWAELDLEEPIVVELVFDEYSMRLLGCI